MKENLQLTGTVESIIFNNPENGYTVFSLVSRGEETICTAYIHSLNLGEHLTVSGLLVNHHNYGPQLNVTTYKNAGPSTAASIEKYLASGAIKGIGTKLASRIIEKFGENTLEIIENAPHKLATIKGISAKMADNIVNAFTSQVEQRKVIMSLAEYDISPSYAIRIYNKYKMHTLSTVKENPYMLSSEIAGIGFKIADKIASKLGIPAHSPYRIKAGIRYILSQSINNGDVCLNKETLIKSTEELLNIEASHINNSLIELQLEKIIVQEKIKNDIVVYQHYFYQAENFVAKKILELSTLKTDTTNNVNESINVAEKKLNISLALEQRQAVNCALTEGALVITGGPGTGKTTIIKTIITLLNEAGAKVELAAPTGRAAKRMTEATDIEAKTIHRLLGITFLDGIRQSFEKNEENTIDADVLIVDEVSMVDLMLMFHLLKAVNYGTRLILVGDVNQLPSVGAGNVLRDIINSNCIKIVSLKEIFRQAAKSLVVVNAHRINMGIYPSLKEKEGDFFFIKRNNQEDIVNTILTLCTKRLIDYGLTQEDIQILCPMRKSLIGAINLNTKLQFALNPPSHDKNEIQLRNTIFREKDKVMQTKNNYNIEWRQTTEEGILNGFGIFNGDEGYINKIDEDSQSVTIEFFDGKIVVYDFKQLEELSLSYAITVHKAQGSEYKAIVMPIFNGPPMLQNRNLLYTALTRAKQLAVFVGTEEALYKMVDNDNKIERNSFLSERLIKIKEFI